MRPIPSTLGRYAAAEDGTIWRYRWPDPPRQVAARAFGGAACAPGRGAYMAVSTCVNGVTVLRSVHRLVAEAWCPDWHPLLEVHHVNGDPADNRPGNLACLTRAEHELAHGRAVRGCDLDNCRYDFELHRDDPVPSPYASPARAAAKGAAQRRWRRSRGRAERARRARASALAGALAAAGAAQARAAAGGVAL